MPRTFPATATTLLLVLLRGSVPAEGADTPATPAAVAAAAPSAVDPAALLARIEKTYRGSPAYRMTFVQTYAPAGFPPVVPETGKLTIQPPASLRFEYDGPEGKLYTFDGETARQYVAADKQMMSKALTPGERARLPLVFLQSPDQVLSRYAAVTRPSPNGLVELDLTPKQEGELRTLTVVALPAGELKSLAIVDAEGNRTTFTFTGLAPIKKRPASDFALVPPKGTKVVTN